MYSTHKFLVMFFDSALSHLITPPLSLALADSTSLELLSSLTTEPPILGLQLKEILAGG